MPQKIFYSTIFFALSLLFLGACQKKCCCPPPPPPPPPTSCLLPSLDSGLAAYYPFNGNANDESGNGNNPIFNNATLTTDRNNNADGAYMFNGVDNYIRIPNSASLNPSPKISLAAIVKPMGFYNGACHGNVILHKGDNQENVGSIYLIMFGDHLYTHGNNCSLPVDTVHQNFYANYGGNWPFSSLAPYTPYVEKEQWYCVAYTFDGTTTNFYLNGTLVASKASSYQFPGNSADLFFGKLNNPQYPYWFNGVIDEVRIYNRSLSTEEVKSLCSTCKIPATK